jgi:hypothetical protein
MLAAARAQCVDARGVKAARCEWQGAANVVVMAPGGTSGQAEPGRRWLALHSAEWTALMRTAVDTANGRQAIAALLHRYGFGVPALSRALRSANDALTLISQGTIRPYQEGKTREMHLHRLPWPTETLRSLGEQEVRLRVTLSYFVEPNPARRGWRARHRYASHGLRFDVKTGDESVMEFRKRLNKQAFAEDGEKPTTSSDSANGFWAISFGFAARCMRTFGRAAPQCSQIAG